MAVSHMREESVHLTATYEIIHGHSLCYCVKVESVGIETYDGSARFAIGASQARYSYLMMLMENDAGTADYIHLNRFIQICIRFATQREGGAVR